MKRLFTICTAIVMTASVWAQSPEKMSYQAVIRNSSNALVTNASIGMQISILQGSASGTAVYVETQTPTTNANGLVSIEIGNGDVQYGDFSSIVWNDGTYFIKSEIDPYGGQNYTITGISQLLSVPYALHAKTAETLSTDIVETDPVFSESAASGISSNDILNWNNKLDSEYDPLFEAWNKSDGITIKESQISDLNHFTNNDETDPIYSSDSLFIKTGARSWNSSLAKTITESDTTYWGRAETDPHYAADSSYIKTATRNWNSSLAKEITETDTTYWGRAETDPYYASDSSFIKTATRSWNSSIAKGITETDTTYWSNKTYIADTDGDTKITTEQASDEDIVRLSVAGNEAFTADNSGFDFVLPTNDLNSNLKVANSDGSVVFGVDGSGMMHGDGSGLSNVKSLAKSAGGNSATEITKNYGWYQNMKSVTLEAPSAGTCFVMASGYVRWESTGWDLYLSSILRNTDPNESWDGENEFYRYLNIATDYNCSDTVDQYASFAQHRSFSVAAGTHTFTLWANKYTSSAKVRMDDLNITVLFFPTDGTGGGTLKSTQIEAINEQ